MTRAHAPGRTFYSFPQRIEEAHLDTVPFFIRTPLMMFERPARQQGTQLALHTLLDVMRCMPQLVPALMPTVMSMADITSRHFFVTADGLYSVDGDGTRRLESRPTTEERRMLQDGAIPPEPAFLHAMSEGDGRFERDVRGERRLRERHRHQRPRARPAIVLPAYIWRFHRQWHHPRPGREAVITTDALVPFNVAVCRTIAPLEPGFVCACGEWYAPVVQPDLHAHGALALYDVAPDVWPRFVPLAVEASEAHYAHVYVVRLQVLDRHERGILDSVIRVARSLVQHAVGHGLQRELDQHLREKLVAEIARQTCSSREELSADYDYAAWTPLQDVLSVWLRRAELDSRGVGSLSLRAPAPGLPKTDRGLDGVIPLSADTSAELLPDVTPPKPDAWAAQNAKIDAAAKPRRSALDMIARCGSNGGGPLEEERYERVDVNDRHHPMPS